MGGYLVGNEEPPISIVVNLTPLPNAGRDGAQVNVDELADGNRLFLVIGFETDNLAGKYGNIGVVRRCRQLAGDVNNNIAGFNGNQALVAIAPMPPRTDKERGWEFPRPENVLMP